jgi:hypothetical protein
MKNKERIAILETEISRLKVANRTANERLEAIEGKLGIEVPRPARSAVVDAMLNRLIAKVEQRKSESNSSEIPNTCEPITPDFIPDWKDAPEDAVCVAMDGNGDWFWWRHKPTSDLSEKGRWNTMSVLKEDGFENGLTETDWFADSATNTHLLPPDYWKSTLMMRPDAVIELNQALHNVLVNHAPNVRSFEPDYTHLIPDGYEFCSEQDAEKWVKVEMDTSHKSVQFTIGEVLDDVFAYVGTWLPIRPIQYKVTTHEIVTAVPDPYMPDWSKAPRWATSHCFNENGYGYWHGIMHDKGRNGAWEQVDIISHLTLPADLDWKQSLRVKPN